VEAEFDVAPVLVCGSRGLEPAVEPVATGATLWESLYVVGVLEDAVSLYAKAELVSALTLAAH